MTQPFPPSAGDNAISRVSIYPRTDQGGNALYGTAKFPPSAGDNAISRASVCTRTDQGGNAPLWDEMSRTSLSNPYHHKKHTDVTELNMSPATRYYLILL